MWFFRTSPRIEEDAGLQELATPDRGNQQINRSPIAIFIPVQIITILISTHLDTSLLQAYHHNVERK